MSASTSTHLLGSRAQQRHAADAQTAARLMPGRYTARVDRTGEISSHAPTKKLHRRDFHNSGYSAVLTCDGVRRDSGI
jgi:hypothetical protein